MPDFSEGRRDPDATRVISGRLVGPDDSPLRELQRLPTPAVRLPDGRESAFEAALKIKYRLAIRRLNKRQRNQQRKDHSTQGQKTGSKRVPWVLPSCETGRSAVDRDRSR